MPVKVLSGVCIGVRVRRSKTGLSQRVSSDVCMGEGSQAQAVAVTKEASLSSESDSCMGEGLEV